MSKRSQRAKITSETLITDLPEFERSNGKLLDVQQTVQVIEKHQSPATTPTRQKHISPRHQTKDIGALILGSDYGKLRNKGKGSFFLLLLFACKLNDANEPK